MNNKQKQRVHAMLAKGKNRRKVAENLGVDESDVKKIKKRRPR